MDTLGTIVKHDWRSFVEDISKHFIYTLFIVITTSCITLAVLFKAFGTYIHVGPANTTTTSSAAQKILTMATPQNSDLYTERGSPYDNRTFNEQTANVVFHGSRDQKKIALTFDAEMTESMRASYVAGIVKSSYDKRIVDTLISTNTKATFFLTGMWIELYPDVTSQLSQNPLFELGSHSYTDSSYGGYCYGLTQLPNTLKIEDIGATEKLLREHGHIDNKLFRFPGGCYTPDDVKLVKEANDTVVHWDVVAADGFNNNTTQIVANVVNNAQNGSIIVLHMNGAPTAPKTAEAIPEIIRQLRAKG